MSRQKAPEKLLSRSDIEYFTGLGKDAVLDLFKNVWAKDRLVVCGQYRIPTSAYNRWIESCREEAQPNG